MKPKKIVLLIDKDEDGRSVTRFVLAQHGLAVLSPRSLADAERIAKQSYFDLVLGFGVPDKRAAVIAKTREAGSILVSRVPRPNALCTVLVNPTMADLLAAIHTGTQKKRGPGKGVARVNAGWRQQKTATAD